MTWRWRAFTCGPRLTPQSSWSSTSPQASDPCGVLALIIDQQGSRFTKFWLVLHHCRFLQEFWRALRQQTLLM